MKPQLVQEYITTGQVALEYRDFIIFDGSEDAAVASMCAADQGEYWRYHDTLFLNAETESAQPFHPTRLEAMAEGIGLDMDQFSDCLENDTYEEVIEQMTAEARDNGHGGTPSFEVNGEIVEWGGYEPLAAAIEEELN